MFIDTFTVGLFFHSQLKIHVSANNSYTLWTCTFFFYLWLQHYIANNKIEIKECLNIP